MKFLLFHIFDTKSHLDKNNVGEQGKELLFTLGTMSEEPYMQTNAFWIQPHVISTVVGKRFNETCNWEMCLNSGSFQRNGQSPYCDCFHLRVVQPCHVRKGALPPNHKRQGSQVAPILHHLGPTLANTEPLTLNFHSIISGKTNFGHILTELNTNK